MSAAPACRANRALGVALALAGCAQPASPAATRPAPPTLALSALDLVGGWRWMLRSEEAGTSRVEDERWRLRPDPAAPGQLVGRYVRTVDVRALDRAPFTCNQRPLYSQRAVFDVTAQLEPTGDAFAVHETAYQTEATPCDPGFRALGDYRAELAGEQLILRWQQGATGGSETLWHVDDALAALPETPWPATPELAGPWRWDASSFDEAGNIRDEHEWWELTRKSETRLESTAPPFGGAAGREPVPAIDATYRRRVTVRSADGAPLPCANAPSWTFDDAYILEARREEEHWHFYELAVDPGDHPCLRATPRRNLDEATAEQIGDYLVLEWRGKRRQILYRPEPAAAAAAAAR